MARHPEVLAVRKMKDVLPALSLLRDLIVDALANVDVKVADPLEKVAHYKILSRLQTQVDERLKKMASPDKPPTTAMKPLL